MVSKEHSESNQFWIIVIVVVLLILIKVCPTQSKPSKYYLEHKKEIDNYREEHANDWDGFQGTRRNSWAEDEKLKHFGIDPDEYRKTHGY